MSHGSTTWPRGVRMGLLAWRPAKSAGQNSWMLWGLSMTRRTRPVKKKSSKTLLIPSTTATRTKRTTKQRLFIPEMMRQMLRPRLQRQKPLKTPESLLSLGLLVRELEYQIVRLGPKI